MSKKVKELAKELEMTNGELLEKIKKMKYEAEDENSELADADATSIFNLLLHQKKKAETTIVKVASSSGKVSDNEEVKIQVKAAAVTAKKTEPAKKSGTAKPAATPVPKSSTSQPPAGKPMPKVASVQAPVGTPMPKAASVQAPVGTPMPKSASVQTPAGTPLPKSASLQPIKEPVGEPVEASAEKSVPAAVAERKEPTPMTEKPAEQPAKQPAVKPEGQAEKTVAEKKPEKAAKPAEPKGKTAEQKAKTEEKPALTPQERLQRLGVKIIKKADPKEEAEEKARRDAAIKARKEADARAKEQKRENADRNRRSDGNRPSGPRADGNRPSGPRTDGNRPSGPRTDRSPSPIGDGNKARKKPEFVRTDKDGDTQTRQSSPRQKKTGGGFESAPVLQKPSVKRERGDKKDRNGKPEDVRKTGKRPEPGKRSMEKPALKKPHKSKEKPVEVEVDNHIEELEPGAKVITVPITVKGLSEQIDRSVTEIIMALMKMGIMANVNQNLDEDTAVLLGDELGVPIVVDKVVEEEEEEALETFEDKEDDLQPRPPIITVMGHVDHGKTSLLDAIRKTNVTAGESGGITQHIGASEVTINGQKIVFLDTPGHEAFTAMRARGASVTDIAVLVVAADDSVKPQTIESISHAKAANVPIIVAINKIDKEGANPDRVKKDLTEHGILVEDWGGETICVPVSAKTGEGIVNLLEMILLQAEVLELRANPNRLAMGTVVEARLDKAKGPVATLLVHNGTLQTGMSVVAGTSSGRIRAMTNFKGEPIRKAGPATAVEILGLTDVPEAGDEFNALRDDKAAREIAEHRRDKVREEVMKRNSKVSLEQFFSQLQEGEIKELNLIIKADVQGSVGALIQSLEKLHNENVRVKIIHSGVGTVTESDIMLAGTAGAVIIGFNVRPSAAVTAMADQDGVEIRTYRIIYEIIDDVEAAMKGMLDPVFKEVVLGQVEIRNTFKVPGVGIVGGAYVTNGKVQRNAQIRLVRDGIVIHEGKISSLKRFKDDAKEVAQGYECGIGIENYNDIKEGDVVEAFVMEQIERE